MVWDLPQSIGLGGTSLLIVIGVALETTKQLEGLMLKRKYVDSLVESVEVLPQPRSHTFIRRKTMNLILMGLPEQVKELKLKNLLTLMVFRTSQQEICSAQRCKTKQLLAWKQSLIWIKVH